MINLFYCIFYKCPINKPISYVCFALERAGFTLKSMPNIGGGRLHPQGQTEHLLMTNGLFVSQQRTCIYFPVPLAPLGSFTTQKSRLFLVIDTCRTKYRSLSPAYDLLGFIFCIKLFRRIFIRQIVIFLFRHAVHFGCYTFYRLIRRN